MLAAGCCLCSLSCRTWTLLGACRALTKLQSTVDRKAGGDLPVTQGLMRPWLEPVADAISNEQLLGDDQFGIWIDPETGLKRMPVSLCAHLHRNQLPWLPVPAQAVSAAARQQPQGCCLPSHCGPPRACGHSTARCAAHARTFQCCSGCLGCEQWQLCTATCVDGMLSHMLADQPSRVCAAAVTHCLLGKTDLKSHRSKSSKTSEEIDLYAGKCLAVPLMLEIGQVRTCAGFGSASAVSWLQCSLLNTADAYCRLKQLRSIRGYKPAVSMCSSCPNCRAGMTRMCLRADGGAQSLVQRAGGPSEGGEASCQAAQADDQGTGGQEGQEGTGAVLLLVGCGALQGLAWTLCMALRCSQPDCCWYLQPQAGVLCTCAGTQVAAQALHGSAG